MSKFHKLLFLISMILGSLITLSSYSWFMMWFGMEINLLSLIPLLTKMNSNNSSESVLKYFIIQALASTMLIFSMIIMENNLDFFMVNFSNVFLLMFHSALFMKLGMAPFHSWFPEVMEGLDWMNCLIIVTWQKIAPMSMLMMSLLSNKFSIVIIVASSILGVLLGFNQTSLRKIIAYSSINHMSWMILSMMYSLKIWLAYFSIYSITNLSLIFYFWNFNISKINQLNFSSMSKTLKFMISLNLLSLSGLPPTIGFFPKWVTISWLVETNNYVLTMILIVSTLISIFFYLRLMFPLLLVKTIELKTKVNSIQKISQAFISSNCIFLLSLPLMNILF